MKFIGKLLILLLVMALTALATFGITTWYYRIPVLKDASLQLYGSIGAGVLSLLAGLLLTTSKKKKKPAVKAEEPAAKAEKKIETAKVITPKQEEMGIMVDEIPIQPEVPEMPAYDEPDIDLFNTSMAMPVITPEQEAAEAEKARQGEPDLQPMGDSVGAENHEDSPEDVTQPFIDDTTRVINIASLREYLNKTEKENTEDKTTVSKASVSPIQTVVSPFGPRSTGSIVEAISQPSGDVVPEKVEEVIEEVIEEPAQNVENTVEEIVTEIPFEEEISFDHPYFDTVQPEEPQQQEVQAEETVPAEEAVPEETKAEEPVEELVEEPVQPEAVQEEEQPEWTATERVITEPEQQPERQLQPEEPADLDNTLTKTREQFITRSNISYIDESGKPQFRVTQEIKKVEVSDEELGIGKDFEGFDVRAERNEKINHILNTIIALLSIGLAMIVIYYFYTKFFG